MDPSRIIHRTELTYTIRDGYPISAGHTLIIPHRHVCSFFGVTPEEKTELLAALDSAKVSLDAEFQPDGYNIGINDGSAAGQTVPHLHIHLIPRFDGDQSDPRGGVRWIFPEKADYWGTERICSLTQRRADAEVFAPSLAECVNSATNRL